MFKELNKKYDALKEPKRFFVFLALIAPGMLLTVGTETGVFGVLWLCALLVLRVLGK